MTEPRVSVYCLLYNMKDYIAQALDGMVMQKTDFPYEIIVHDDASTDGSTDILREYAEKYPDLITPIYQTENQYSKKTGILKNFVYPRLRGEFVCSCEGDDYWTDPLKLQKQYDFMSTHPEYSLCAAKVRQINCKDPSIPDRFVAPVDYTGEVSFEQIIMQGDKQAFATCSLFYRKDVLFSRNDEFPSGGGDRFKVLWLALNGKVWFINEEVGVYRRERPGSWSEANWQSGKEKKLKLLYAFIKVHGKVDKYCGLKYNSTMQHLYLSYMKKILRAGGKYRDITKGEIKEYYDCLSSDKKCSLIIYKLLLPARKVAHAIKRMLRKR